MYACNSNMGYYPLPCTVPQLDNFMCADLNRHGRLCGRCKNGYALPVYSYDLACVKCDNYKYNWLKYLAVTFGPLTLFYIVVSLFAISFTSPWLSGLVTVSQVGAHPVQIQIFLILAKSGHIVAPKLLKFVLSLLALWNLDYILRLLSASGCISNDYNGS